MHVALLSLKAVDSATFNGESQLVFMSLMLAKVVELFRQVSVHSCEAV